MGGLFSRRRGRLIASACGVAIGVGLLASIGSFLSASKATMTRRAASTVAVDWQVEAQSGADPATVLSATRAARGVVAALPVAFAATTGLQATTGGSTQSTGSGLVLGIPAGYRRAFPGEIRDLTGAGSGVLIAQQTAANLHAAPGDLVSIGRAGLAPVTVTVDGVVDLPGADSLFQLVGAPAGSQPQAPPDNLILLGDAQWHQLFDPLAVARPDLVRNQVHARVSHALPADPSAAFAEVTGRAHNLEVNLAGAGLVGDNLSATLDAARKDSLYAQVLFLFLGLPGAVLAALLTGAVARVGAPRRRRDQALLRARGATSRTLVALGMGEALGVGLLGAAAGLLAALGVGRLAFGTVGFGATTGSAIAWAGTAALAGLAIAALTLAIPAGRDARAITVAAGRRTVGRETSPRWQRYGLDLVLLAAGGLIFWLTGRGGYALVLAPEGVPTISVSYWAFAGPALLWWGAGLLAWRLADRALLRGRGILARLLHPLSGSLSDTIAASMSRQRRPLARGLVLVGLTGSFAISVAVFNATYRQQAEVDARLTNGANVTVNEPPSASVGPGGGSAFARIPGVAAVEPLQHRFAYVGNDLQDLYGVRARTIGDATKLQDAYFSGGTAQQLMARLAAQPDSILVAAETVLNFQLQPGDRLNLRLQNGPGGPLIEVPFRYAGVAKEFPTAPKDSFLVANADYVARMTASPAVGAFLIDTRGRSPAAVASDVRRVVGTQAQVVDITSSRQVIGSSLTAVDLAGLTRVELGFALVLAAAATGLVLALGLAERRRTFAIAGALGARARQLGGFVWGEAAFVTLGGLVLGGLAGWGLSEVLVKVLTGVFDPPPAGLSVPWAYLAAVAGVGAGAAILAAWGAIRSTRRPALVMLRDL